MSDVVNPIAAVKVAKGVLHESIRTEARKILWAEMDPTTTSALAIDAHAKQIADAVLHDLRGAVGR